VRGCIHFAQNKEQWREFNRRLPWMPGVSWLTKELLLAEGTHCSVEVQLLIPLRFGSPHIQTFPHIPIRWTKRTHSCTNYCFIQNNSSCRPASKTRTPFFSSSATFSKNDSELIFTIRINSLDYKRIWLILITPSACRRQNFCRTFLQFTWLLSRTHA